MIKVNFNPIRAGHKTELSINGSIVTLNGDSFDLSLLDDGTSAKHDKLGSVTRNGTDYEITITLNHGKDAPHETRFPAPLKITGEYIHEYEFGGLK